VSRRARTRSGSSSLQVCRRLWAVLRDLLIVTPDHRHARIEDHLARLDAAVVGAFPDGSAERELAQEADRTGLGLGRS
jgi:hypothetical protein